MIEEGKKVCVAIMDIHESEPENNPYTYEEVLDRIFEAMIDEIQSGKVKVIKIPPIDSVNYGRDVGYDLNELIPPDNIKQISATRIRNEL
jgi:hypothetical protein